MPAPKCPTHHVALVCPCCEQARRGAVASDAKAAAARANGKRGGRPRKVITDDVRRKQIMDAENRSAQWLADGNAYAERGRKTAAEKCYDKATHWLYVANKLRGWA